MSCVHVFVTKHSDALFKMIYRMRHVNYAALKNPKDILQNTEIIVKWAGPLWGSCSSWLRRLNECFLGTLQFLTHFSLEYPLEA